jgi:mono/diheme cytochrome c family protein
MDRTHSRPRVSVIVATVVVLVGLAAAGGASYMMAPRLTPEMRGHDLAERLGCHGCHGPRGTGGVPNPKSDDVEIPAWDGGMAMMYVKSDDEIRGWILDGVPHRVAHEHEGHHHGEGEEHGEGAEQPAPPIRMPAFRSVIDENELADLVAYYKVVAVWDTIPESAMRGHRTAAQRGCFGCHGPGGMIGARNPGSFKGYIPPWRGKDFAELVKSEKELRSWIRDGTIPRFEKNPLARFFSHRQVIQMPAYRDVLTEEEIGDMVVYIQWRSREAD